MTATNETLVDESLLLYKILRRIPYGRWISTIDIANELEASGVEISTRRLQRFLKRISSDEEFCALCDVRSKPYGYRRFKRESDLSEVSLKAEEALILRLSEERLKYLLPSPVIDSLRPIFDRARELMKEEAAKGASARERGEIVLTNRFLKRNPVYLNTKASFSRGLGLKATLTSC